MSTKTELAFSTRCSKCKRGLMTTWIRYHSQEIRFHDIGRCINLNIRSSPGIRRIGPPRVLVWPIVVANWFTVWAV